MTYDIKFSHVVAALSVRGLHLATWVRERLIISSVFHQFGIVPKRKATDYEYLFHWGRTVATFWCFCVGFGQCTMFSFLFLWEKVGGDGKKCQTLPSSLSLIQLLGLFVLPYTYTHPISVP